MDIPCAMASNLDASYSNALEPYVFSVIDIKKDVLTQSLLLCALDKDKLIEVQESEIYGLKDKVIFEDINKRDLSYKSNLLSSIQSYRCKQCSGGTLWKHKARLCVAGS